MNLSQEVVARANFLEDVFPCLQYGRRILDSGAAQVAHDVRLLRELLTRREAELHGRIFNAVVNNENGAFGQTKALGRLQIGAVVNDQTLHSGVYVDPIVERIMKGLVAGEDPRETVVNMVSEAVAFDPATATEEGA